MNARATSTVLAALLVASLTGCTFLAAQTNQKHYDPSDGIGTTVGSVDVRNALLVTEDGEVANLSVSIVNTGAENVSLQVSWMDASGDQASQDVFVQAGETSTFGTDPQIILSGIDSAPGELFPVFFQYGSEQGHQILVPVLDGTLSEYTDLVPASE